MPRTGAPPTLEPLDRLSPTSPATVLVEGMRLDQTTFHALYESMPSGFRAELIEGVVRMPSPVGYTHGEFHQSAIAWLSYYRESTPGLQVLDNATAILGNRSEPQPDAMLRILPEHGGQTRNEEGYVVGAPELILEVASSTRYIDLGPKLNDYERAGVREYIVLAANPDEVLWFAREGEALVAKQPSDDGLFRSSIFPGLWLDPQALIRGDTKRLREVLALARATPEHEAFVAALAAAKPIQQG